MGKNIKESIHRCDVCQRYKIEHTKLIGLLQLLPIPLKIWEDISMNFVRGCLPKVVASQQYLLLLIDCLSVHILFHFLIHIRLLE